MTRDEINKRLAETYRELTKISNRAGEISDVAYNAIEDYLDDWMIDHRRQRDFEGHSYSISLFAEDHSYLEINFSHRFDVGLINFDTRDRDYWENTMLRLEEEVFDLITEFRSLRSDFIRTFNKAKRLHEEAKICG